MFRKSPCFKLLIITMKHNFLTVISLNSRFSFKSHINHLISEIQLSRNEDLIVFTLVTERLISAFSKLATIFDG